MSSFDVMLEFLRAGVLKKKATISIDTSIDWDSLMDISASHGVLALVWDGIQSLPSNQRPPRLQSINWGLSAQDIWDNYKHQETVLNQMVQECQKHNMRLLLLKGIGLSKLYPKPQSRPCGDIDIYLFGEYEKGNEFICKGVPDEITELHSEFFIDKVHVENHRYFIYPNTKTKKTVGNYVLSHQDEATLTSDGYYVLPPLSNLAYLMMHALNHFYYSIDSSVISVRNIVDLGLFIYKNQDGLPPLKTYEIMHSIYLDKSFEVIVYISEWLLDIDLSSYHKGRIKEKDIRRIKSVIFEDVNEEFLRGLSLWRKSVFLWKRYYRLLPLSKYVPKKPHNGLFYMMCKKQMSLLLRRG